MVPNPGTSGYYVDGWCDVASDLVLLVATGVLLARQEISKDKYLPLVEKKRDKQTLFVPWIWIGIGLLGLQVST